MEFFIKTPLFFLVLASMVTLPAKAYHFSKDPNEWNDAEVETFLFLSQIQKKTGLNGKSNLCIDISSPVQGGKQRMRILSKTGDNSNGGLFVKGKAEIAESNAMAKHDLQLIKTMVGMASGYQQSIMNYDESSIPKAKDPEEAKKLMTAEVIGYTDGQAISNTSSAALNGTGKSFSTNKQLGMYRADFLQDELGLTDTFGFVKKSSKESESALRDPKYSELRNCDTWRTAEVRMYFQSGGNSSNESTWAMSTMTMEGRERALVQFEAGRQIAEALRSLSLEVLTKEGEGAETTRLPSPELMAYCQSVHDFMTNIYSRNMTCKITNPRPFYCKFECSGEVESFYVSLGLSGDDFYQMEDSIYNIRFKGNDNESLRLGKESFTTEFSANRVKKMKDLHKVLVDRRKSLFDSQLKKSFPECASDPIAFADIKKLAELVGPTLDPDVAGPSIPTLVKSVETYGYSKLGKVEQGAFELDPSIKAFVTSVTPKSKKDESGRVTRLMKCMDMKNVMNEIYAKGECRPGSEFSKVTFPHQNVTLGCVYCGSGWKTQNGIAYNKERDTLVESKIESHDHGSTHDRATVDALRSPGVHEIKDCSNCNCDNKAMKLSKIYSVEKASDENLVPKIDKNSCYCTPPVVPSCGVGPTGKTDEPKTTTLTQKYFFDACQGDFVKVSGNNQQEQISNLLNSFVKGCSTDPSKCGKIEISSAISQVNAMLCEKQNYPIPSDDPVKDCREEHQKRKSGSSSLAK